MDIEPRVTLLKGDFTFAMHAFSAPLPIPDTIDGTGRGTIVMRVEQTEQWLGLHDASGNPIMTAVWGVGAAGGPVTYPGPIIQANSGSPTTIMWQNKLPYTEYPLPFDPSIHGVDEGLIEAGLKPLVMHVHGAHAKAVYDGTPLQWYTQQFEAVGETFTTNKFTYDNDQEGAFLWYHDHVIGMTRTNVYMGIAGGYVLRDETMDSLQAAKGKQTPVLPEQSHELPLIIQDRAFTADGRLYMPGWYNDPLPGLYHDDDGTDPVLVSEEFPGIPTDHPSIVPEFFGDHILVNGMAWPTHSVQKGDYLLDLLNGSDSRFYVLQFDNAWVEAHLVGSDGGLLKNPITIMDGDGMQQAGEQLVLAPGDRAQVVVEFDGVPDGVDAVRLLNVGPDYSPFKGLHTDGSLEDADAATADDPVGNIMLFTLDAAPRGNQPVSTSLVGEWNHDPETAPDLNGDYAPIDTTNAKERLLGLFEGTDDLGRVTPMLGTAENEAPGGPGIQMFGFMDEATEVVTLGDTEVWKIHNFSEDAHPIHLHLVQFQVLSRQSISFTPGDDGLPVDSDNDGIYYEAGDITYDDEEPFLYNEDHGWQDTVWVEPGQMVQIAATFDKAGDYVWHCHILSHEDHDMMRPLIVEDPAMVA